MRKRNKKLILTAIALGLTTAFALTPFETVVFAKDEIPAEETAATDKLTLTLMMKTLKMR